MRKHHAVIDLAHKQAAEQGDASDAAVIDILAQRVVNLGAAVSAGYVRAKPAKPVVLNLDERKPL